MYSGRSASTTPGQRAPRPIVACLTSSGPVAWCSPSSPHTTSQRGDSERAWQMSLGPTAHAAPAVGIDQVSHRHILPANVAPPLIIPPPSPSHLPISGVAVNDAADEAY